MINVTRVTERLRREHVATDGARSFVADIAAAFVACLDAPREAIHNQAINVGRNGENYQIRDVAEIVGAAVVAREGVALDAGALQEELRQHLAGFKIPAHIWLRNEQLPRIASGKIFKRQLKQDYADRLTAES